MCSLHQNDRFHIVCVGSLIDLERVQRSLKVLQPCKSWSRLQALNKGVIEVQLLEVEVKVLWWEAAHGAGTKTDFKSNAEKSYFKNIYSLLLTFHPGIFWFPPAFWPNIKNTLQKESLSLQAFCNEMLGNRVGFCQPQNLYYNCRHFLLVAIFCPRYLRTPRLLRWAICDTNHNRKVSCLDYHLYCNVQRTEMC